MTLKEFSQLAFSYKHFPTEIIVIYDELAPEDINKNEIIFTLKSYYKSEGYLQEKFLNAKITEIYAYKRDKFIVAIENEEKYILGDKK